MQGNAHPRRGRIVNIAYYSKCIEFIIQQIFIYYIPIMELNVFNEYRNKYFLINDLIYMRG